jgi:hypothetical protein
VEAVSLSLHHESVKVTLRPTAGQSVCLGVEPRLLTVRQLWSCPIRAPSLTRGRVCLLSVIVSSLCQCVHEVFTV